ncbi:ADP-ribosylglycohydrolase family protein [Novosphingobium terrae]|uniref:ADP-ribosylglycohydrolase family protein n=1 Tax=Novosphingobium terrae TaxID=2726189 RepID=UPI001F13B0A9|nr:ADP-ribosylglycohydrolase family protein [Novosphingobium terrae]
MIDLQTQDRALGALLGLATGDALGTTLEFSARDSLPPLTDIVGGGPFQLEAGVWTDDTSMALALAESLAQRGSLDPGDLMRRFVNWWRWGVYSATGECFDIGMATRSALARFEADGNPIAGSTDTFSAGNGSLMRLAPVAIWGVKHGEKAMRDAARLQSATTHGATACLDACEGYALILRAAILGADFETALKAAEGVGSDPIAAILAGGWRGKARAGIQSSGYVAHSLEAALWCVDQTETYRDAVLLAANLGDDADTTAAITGQLAGALYGMQGIPAEWLARLAWRERIAEMAQALLVP